MYLGVQLQPLTPDLRKQLMADAEDGAVEKVVAGPERRSRRLGPEEKRRVAYHETGHALVAAYSPHADPVHKVKIVPRGRAALGYTMQLPADEQLLLTRSALLDRLRVLLGGRAAEEVVFGEVSTGAENGLERATALARQMVCVYGMGESAGLAHVGQRPARFLSDGEAVQLDCSEATARQVDAEVKGLLDAAYREAKGILTGHREELERVAQELLCKETLDGAAFRASSAPGRPAGKGRAGEVPDRVTEEGRYDTARGESPAGHAAERGEGPHVPSEIKDVLFRRNGPINHNYFPRRGVFSLLIPMDDGARRSARPGSGRRFRAGSGRRQARAR